MLIRFRVSNFRSIREEQELSMVAAFKDGRKDLVRVDSQDLDLLRVAGIYGANAAGKSNVLEALRFMRNAVISSHRSWIPEGEIPREPFLLTEDCRRLPSLFEADFLLEGVRYQYGFEVDDKEILKEWLFAFPNARRQVWFLRDVKKPEPFQFGKNLKGSNRAIERLTRVNSLFLSNAATNAHKALGRIYSWFQSSLVVGDATTRDFWAFSTARLLMQEHDAILDLLQLADLGIVDVKLKEFPPRPQIRRWLETANRSLEFMHQSEEGPKALTLEQQSRGTQAWFALAGTILLTLRRGAVLCVDELEASLHPYLTREIIRIFQNPEKNLNNAQLIFNTHDTTLLGNLLGEAELHRDQIWFVEKDQEGASHLYPLTDFKPRKFENVERGYLQGRYGAIPFIGPIMDSEDA